MELKTHALDRVIEALSPTLAKELERLVQETREELERAFQQRLQGVAREAQAIAHREGEAEHRASPNESQLALPRSNHFRARNVSGVVLLHEHDDINGIWEEFRDWNVCSFELGGVEVAPNRSGAVNTNVATEGRFRITPKNYDVNVV
jgi:hypothetical protein